MTSNSTVEAIAAYSDNRDHVITTNQETTMTSKKSTTTTTTADPSKNRTERRAAAKAAVATSGAPKPTGAAVELSIVVPGGTGKIVQPTTAGVSIEEIEAMSQVERLQACKPERAALAEWKKGGRQGDRPLTPIMAWLENPTKVTAAAKRSASKRVEVTRTAEQQQQLVDTIQGERKAGTSWFSIAKKLTDLSIPATSNGCQWFNTTAFGTAKRLGLVEDGEGLSRRPVAKTAKPVAAKKAAAAKKPAAVKSTERKAPGQRPAVKAAASSKKVTAKK